MVAIVVWGCAAWAFGIPTSESHALIAGLTGAAIALQGGVAGVNWGEWSKVIWGLALSIAVGLALGLAISRLLRWAFAELANHQANVLFSKLQVAGAGLGAFMHGAQDGQKFLSTAMLAVMLSTGRSMQGQTSYPVWLMVLCASVLSLGVASDMVLTWVLTFPGCGLVGYVLARVFLQLL
jgi:PiT family inorganic phosphate transporter